MMCIVREGRLFCALEGAEAIKNLNSVFVAGSTPNHCIDVHADLSDVCAAAEEIPKLIEGLTTIITKRPEAANLLLPSKLTAKLASGRPLVAMAAAGSGLAAEAEDCGFAIVPTACAMTTAGILHLVPCYDPAGGAE